MKKDNAYIKGLRAGSNWFWRGIKSGEWKSPINPYKSGTSEYDLWEKGECHGSGDAEAYYES